MASFWDQRARENALFYVDNRLDYGRPDEERFWTGGQEALDHILGSLGVEIASGDHVVEIGCGVGRVTRAIAARADRVTAVDVSGEMLARARAWTDADNISWLQNDGATLAEIPDASADVCFSHVTFQHLPEADITLGYVREMGRVLKPSGFAAFQLSNDPGIHARARGPNISQRIKALVGQAPRGQEHPAWRGSAVSLQDLRTAAETAGLAVERIVGEGTQFCLVLLRRP